MCDLCGNDVNVRIRELNRMDSIARGLRELATMYDKAIHGELKPHTIEFKAIGLSAHYVIRELTADWV